MQPIDISRAPGPHQTNRSGMHAAAELWDGRTDRRTLDSFIDPAQHTMRAVSVILLIMTVASFQSNFVKERIAAAHPPL